MVVERHQYQENFWNNLNCLFDQIISTIWYCNKLILGINRIHFKITIIFYSWYNEIIFIGSIIMFTQFACCITPKGLMVDQFLYCIYKCVTRTLWSGVHSIDIVSLSWKQNGARGDGNWSLTTEIHSIVVSKILKFCIIQGERYIYKWIYMWGTFIPNYRYC